MLLGLSLMGVIGMGSFEIIKTLSNSKENKQENINSQEKIKLYDDYPVIYSKEDEEGVQIATNYYIQNNDSYKHAMYLNTMIIGSPDAWKSTVGIYPNLLNKKLRGTIIINDPKGEFYRNTSEIQKSFGRKIKRISFNEINDKINVLRELENEEDIFEFSKTIMMNGLSENSKMSQDSITWINLSATLLTSILCYVKYYSSNVKRNTDNLAEALLLLQLVEDDIELEDIIKNNDLAYKYFLAYKSGGGKTTAKSNILLNINSALAIYLNSKVRAITEKTTIDLNDIRTNEYAIYISGDEIGSNKMSAVITPIFQLLLKKSIELGPTPFMSEEEKNKILDIHFFLDEFGNIGKINNLNQYLTMMRAYKVSMYMVLQSFSQLSNVYNESEIGAIMAGVGHVLFLTNNREKTTISKIMEMSSTIKKELLEKEYSSDGTLIKVKQKYVDQQIISQNEAGSIQRGEGILFVGSQEVMKIKFNRWFEEDRYNSYANSIANSLEKASVSKKIIDTYKIESTILNKYRESHSKETSTENTPSTKNVTMLNSVTKPVDKFKKEIAITKEFDIPKHTNPNKQKIEDSYKRFLNQNFS